MKLTFLGSAAAEGFPALWCRCERCTVARARGGRNLRYRSSLLINDDLLVDPGPDVLAAAIRQGLDLSPLQLTLVTHPHTDHLEPSTFFWRRKGFVATALPLLHVYASQASIRRMTELERRTLDPQTVQVQHHPTGAFQHFVCDTGGAVEADPRFPDGQLPPLTARRYEVQTLAASHAEPAQEPVFFAIRQTAGPEAAGRDAPPALLYATDTGPFRDETWEALERLGTAGWRFNATAVDATMGLGRDGGSHMNLAQMEWHQRELERRGLLAPGAHLYAHHFSHNGTPPYEELEAYLSERGLHSTFDGMELAL